MNGGPFFRALRLLPLQLLEYDLENDLEAKLNLPGCPYVGGDLACTWASRAAS